MDYQSKIGDFFEKFSTWRKESDKELSNIFQFHSKIINSYTHGLVEEVNDLKIKLSVITKERNDLIQTVHNLSNDIHQMNAELPSPQATPQLYKIHQKDNQKIFSHIDKAEHSKEHNE